MSAHSVSKSAKDIAGQRFGRLIAVKRTEQRSAQGNFLWACACDCGNEALVPTAYLIAGNTKSCGCGRRKRIGAEDLGKNLIHSAEGKILTGMLQRCGNPNVKSYKDYGGRGITVCDRWKNSLRAFIDDMGLRPSPRHSIERINHNGNYEPGNCKWATKAEQARNTRTNKYVEVDGKWITQSELARMLGVSPSTVCQQIKRGVPLERILNPTVGPRRRVAEALED